MSVFPTRAPRRPLQNIFANLSVRWSTASNAFHSRPVPIMPIVSNTKANRLESAGWNGGAIVRNQ